MKELKGRRKVTVQNYPHILPHLSANEKEDKSQMRQGNNPVHLQGILKSPLNLLLPDPKLSWVGQKHSWKGQGMHGAVTGRSRPTLLSSFSRCPALSLTCVNGLHQALIRGLNQFPSSLIHVSNKKCLIQVPMITIPIKSNVHCKRMCKHKDHIHFYLKIQVLPT